MSAPAAMVGLYLIFGRWIVGSCFVYRIYSNYNLCLMDTLFYSHNVFERVMVLNGIQSFLADIFSDKLHVHENPIDSSRLRYLGDFWLVCNIH